jgi:hypothetical protein
VYCVLASRETQAGVGKGFAFNFHSLQNQNQMSNFNKPKGPQPVTTTVNMLGIMPLAPFTRGPQPFQRSPEPVDKSTRTIPDDSFSIRELYDRYQKGAPLPLGIERPIRYSENPEHSDLDMGRISRLDLAETSDLTKRVKDTLIALKARQEALIAAKNDDKTTKQAASTAAGFPPVE